MGANQLARYLRKTSAIGQMIYDNIIHRLPKPFSPVLKLNDGMKEPFVLFRRWSDNMDENNRNSCYFTALSNKDLTPMFDIECAYPLKIVGLSNGVFCFDNQEDSNYVLWNPSTNEHKIIPSPPFPRPSGSGEGILTECRSFTFDISNLDCKVLHSVTHFCENEDGYPLRILKKYELYSLEKDTWKEMTRPGLYQESLSDNRVSVGGVSYSIAQHVACGFDDQTVIAFDFEAEEFYTLPLPETGKKLNGRPYRVSPSDYDGSLSAMVYPWYQGGPVNLELWVLTDNRSWEKVFEVSLYFNMSRRFIFVKKDVLLFYDKYWRSISPQKCSGILVWVQITSILMFTCRTKLYLLNPYFPLAQIDIEVSER